MKASTSCNHVPGVGGDGITILPSSKMHSFTPVWGKVGDDVPRPSLAGMDGCGTSYVRGAQYILMTGLRRMHLATIQRVARCDL
jgi:hypothetical protein